MKIKAVFCLFLLAILGQIYCDQMKTPKDFEGGFFQFSDTQSGLYEVNIWQNMEEDDLNGNIMMGFGDYDGNTYTDFLTLSVTKTAGKMYLYDWSEDNSNFEKISILDQLEDGLGQYTVTIYPVDINYDGLLDIAVLFNVPSKPEGNITQRSLVGLLQVKDPQNPDKITFERPSSDKDDISSVAMSPYSQPFFANIKNQIATGKSKGALERKTQIIHEDIEGTRKVLDVQTDNNEKDVQVNVDSNEDFTKYTCSEGRPKTLRKFATPHYNAVVDINGDCMSDLVFTTQDEDKTYLEFWIYDGQSEKYCFKQEHEIDLTDRTLYGISFADFDFNGGVDIALLYNTKDSVEIQIALNDIQVDSNDLCQVDNDWRYTNLEGKGENNYVMKDYQLLLNEEELKTAYITNQLRFGDVNLDGYNDLILVMKKGDSNPLPYIILNKTLDNKDKKYVTLELQSEENQNFALNQVYNNDSGKKKYFVQAAFFDINENGILDMYMNYYDEETQSIKISAVYNYIKNENYFLKTLGLNGQCDNSKCQSALYYGASYMCKITVTDNSNRAGRGVQLSQSAYQPLQLPFSILGLGRTNNYIENLMAGYPQKTDDDNEQHATWQTIIPNSQLIIYPYDSNAEKWKISIFIQPTKAVIVVIIVTASILFVLGLTIVYCHIREKEEDRKNSESLYQIFR